MAINNNINDIQSTLLNKINKWERQIIAKGNNQLFEEEKAHARLVPLHEKQLKDLENGHKKTIPFIDGARAVLAVVAVLCSFAGAFVFFLIKTIFEKSIPLY